MIKERYFPSENEMKILIPNLRLYFKYQERSNERKNIIENTLNELNPNWDYNKVRIWFKNNKKNFININKEIQNSNNIEINIPEIHQNKFIDNSDSIPPIKNSFLNNKNNNESDLSSQDEYLLPEVPIIPNNFENTNENVEKMIYLHYNYLNDLRIISKIENLPEIIDINKIEEYYLKYLN